MVKIQTDIAIVITAFNRPQALSRLLKSVANADYSKYADVPLIISIDFSGKEDCYRIAEDFIWQHGKKTIISQPVNLGLKKHILQCGDLTSEYDAVIILEDDLFVSPMFYDFAQQAFAFYKNDDHVAGIGLFNYPYNEFANCPFEPLNDGYDNYFMQIPCSCGQLFSGSQWKSFRQYLAAETFNEEMILMPQAALNWPAASSWKRSFFKYIIDTERYFVYPQISMTTNFGDAGEHYSEPVYIWQTALLYNNKNFSFSTIEQSKSVYDAFFELDGAAYNRLTGKNISLSFDLNGVKPLHKIKTEYLVSSKCNKKPEAVYLPELYPYECNVIAEIKADLSSAQFFSFGKTSMFSEQVVFHRLNTDVNRVFFNSLYISAAAKKEVYHSLPFRTGMFFLAPWRFAKRIGNRLKRLLKN